MGRGRALNVWLGRGCGDEEGRERRGSRGGGGGDAAVEERLRGEVGTSDRGRVVPVRASGRGAPGDGVLGDDRGGVRVGVRGRRESPRVRDDARLAHGGRASRRGAGAQERRERGAELHGAGQTRAPRAARLDRGGPREVFWGGERGVPHLARGGRTAVRRQVLVGCVAREGTLVRRREQGVRPLARRRGVPEPPRWHYLAVRAEHPGRRRDDQRALLGLHDRRGDGERLAVFRVCRVLEELVRELESAEAGSRR
mmetsp:Transcript_16998/g.53069  ORF Transcript_16998/g.53069 Transcript_16998/m.53069 type:complete len:255 (+) Transcript_16998:171-935(+)